MSFSGAASAADCELTYFGTLPDSYCDTSNGTGTDVCQTSGTTITCDLERLTTTEITHLYAILYSSNFQFIGEDYSGDTFCCILSASGITRIDVLGTAETDWIYLNDGASTPTYNLGPYNANLTAVVSGRAGDDTIDGSYYATGSYTYLDDLRGDAGDDTIRGREGADYLFGNDDDDFLHGNDDEDQIFGGSGADYMTGGADADNMVGGSGADEIYGEAGEDTINGNEDDDLISGGTDADDLSGDDGADTIYGGDGADIIVGDAGADNIYGESGTDTINGNSGTDTIRGGDSDDLIHGDGDDDAISGGLGTDSIFGDDGHDTMCGDQEVSSFYPDSLYGGAGNDTIWGPAADCTVGMYNQGAGDAGTDACDNCSTPGYSPSCESSISVRPAGCP